MDPLRHRRLVTDSSNAVGYDRTSVWNGRLSDDKKKLDTKLDGRLVFLIVALFYIFIVALINFRVYSYPTPKTVIDSVKTDFVEERAREHLNKITGFGARVAGSAATVQAEHYILNELEAISQLAGPANVVTVDVQKVGGSLALEFIGMGEFTNVYENIPNVIAKLSPKEPVSHSVLINCHFDTVTDSPGASDSAVSCCLMLEILRALSRHDTPLAHNIIFLFNGAEEDIMQASHGFITKHPWATNIGAFVNLDSAGAGGWEIVFQTGPEHPWLVKAYASSAVYPCGSVFSQEIFQSGLVPSDTDYRIFRDFGNIAGLDIAHIQNGFVYHTQNDVADMVAAGCMQRGGENVMSLLMTLASSPQVVNPGDDKHGSMVFYDVVGLFMVYYPQRVAVIINWTVVILMLVYFGKKVSNSKGGFQNYIFQVLGAVLGVLVTWLVVLVCVLVVALTVTILGRDMSWFTVMHNIIWLYLLPGAAGGLGIHLLLKHLVYTNWDAWKVESLYFDANLFVWTAVLALATYSGIMSAYIALLWIVCPVVIRSISAKLFTMKSPGNQWSVFAVSLSTVLLPSVYTLYLVIVIFQLFTPIMGRLPAVMPDLPISILAGFSVILCISPHIGLVYISRRMSQVVIAMATISLVGITAVLVTPLGFPFTADKVTSSQQRAMFLHIDRRFHNIDREYKNASSIWYIPFDYHGIKSIKKYAPEVFKDAVPVQCEGAYCGRPYTLPVVSMYQPGYCVDVPAPPLNLSDRFSIKSVKKEQLSADTVRLTLQVTGPNHRSCYISLRSGVSLKRWSMGSGYPKPSKTEPIFNQTTYFLYYAHGEGPPRLWEFFVEFHVDRRHSKSEPIVDIAFSGHYLHGEKKTTPALESFTKKLPPWTAYVSWVATYDMYQF